MRLVTWQAPSMSRGGYVLLKFGVFKLELAVGCNAPVKVGLHRPPAVSYQSNTDLIPVSHAIAPPGPLSPSRS